MNNEPLISIIIPIYNVEKYLPKCLESIINQTYTNLEIICVNDGSIDSTANILSQYQSKDDRFIIINQENSGASESRNKALDYVTGDYIMFIDGDDWIDENTCEIALSKALSNNYDMVIWNYIREFENNSLQKQIFENKEIIFDEDAVKHRLQRRTIGLYREELSQPENADSIVTIWGKLYRASIIVNHNLKFVDLKCIGTSEDALFNLEVYKYVNSVIYIPDYLYHYRKDNQSSVTTVYKSKLFLQWNNLYNVIEDYIIFNELGYEYEEALNNRISLAIISLGLNILNAGRELNKVGEIKKIISSPRYRQAYKQLKLKYFPIHWKLFFAFAKYNFAYGVYLMLKAINMLRGK